jgi:hypothetical protein
MARDFGLDLQPVSRLVSLNLNAAGGPLSLGQAGPGPCALPGPRLPGRLRLAEPEKLEKLANPLVLSTCGGEARLPGWRGRRRITHGFGRRQFITRVTHAKVRFGWHLRKIRVRCSTGLAVEPISSQVASESQLASGAVGYRSCATNQLLVTLLADIIRRDAKEASNKEMSKEE